MPDDIKRARELREIEDEIRGLERVEGDQLGRLLTRIERLPAAQRQRMFRLLAEQEDRLFARLSPEEQQELLAQGDGEVEAHAIESQLTPDELERALRIQRIADVLALALWIWPLLSVIGALILAERVWRGYVRWGDLERGLGLHLFLGWAAIGLAIIVAWALGKGVRTCYSASLRRSGHSDGEIEEIWDLVEWREYEEEAHMRRRTHAERQADLARWRSERAAAPPWWRRETSGGHLLLNIYIVAGGLVAATPAARAEPSLLWLIPLFAIAVFVKLGIPMIALMWYMGLYFFVWIPLALIISSLSRRPVPELQEAAKESWRIYDGCGRSRAIIASMLAFGLVGAGIGLYVAFAQSASALGPSP
ncbi:MAG: hypothetical protein JSV65_07665 [Armatimonadota bacterium]|nr:MAG: hypothetical protein JSV65_07665 [Armatimonadota bacterium]